jgi:hypothetical protein
LLLLVSIQTVHADSLPTGCLAGYNFSPTTGQPCTLPDCSPGDLFSGLTGKPCGQYIPGCYSFNGYSVLTGTKCDSSEASIPSSIGSDTPIVPQSQSTTVNSDTLQISVPTTTLIGNYLIFPIDLKYAKTNVDNLVVSIQVNNNVADTMTLNHQISNTVTYPSLTEAVIHYDTYLQVGDNTISISAGGVTQSFSINVSE